MLTGTRAFQGDDISQILAAVIRGEPDWTRLPPDRLARHPAAASSMPRQRPRSEHSGRGGGGKWMRFQWKHSGVLGVSGIGGGGPRRRHGPSTRRLVALVAVCALAAAIVSRFRDLGKPTRPGVGNVAQVGRFPVFTPTSSPTSASAIASDGLQIAYKTRRARNGTRQLSTSAPSTSSSPCPSVARRTPEAVLRLRTASGWHTPSTAAGSAQQEASAFAAEHPPVTVGEISLKPLSACATWGANGIDCIRDQRRSRPDEGTGYRRRRRTLDDT